MDKYHTLFLSDNGSVYSCGIGVGGRLGHDNEEPVLVRNKFNQKRINLLYRFPSK
jgi:alpha-tubulin suppressor-like RCC1 family protein